jgi:spore coat-associated protein N
MSRKMLLSLMVLALAVAAIGAGTLAAFSDTELSTGNKFTAGTLDLKVSDSTWHSPGPGVDPATGFLYTDDPIVKMIEVENVKPGDAWVQVGHQVTLKNFGTVPGKVWYEIVNLRNEENGLTEPEIQAGDTTANVGELPAELQIMTTENQAPWAGWLGLTKLDSTIVGQKIQGHVLASGESVPLVFRYRWDPAAATGDDNLSQTDKITFDIVFHMDQVH